MDYKKYDTSEELVVGIKEALMKGGAPHGRAFYAFDAVSESPTFDQVLSPVLAGLPQEGTGQKPRLAVIIPNTDYSQVDSSIDVLNTMVSIVHTGGQAEQNLGYICSHLFGKGLEQGWFSPHPHEVLAGGLDGLEEALNRLKSGKVRGAKLVGRIRETRGL